MAVASNPHDLKVMLQQSTKMLATCAERTRHIASGCRVSRATWQRVTFRLPWERGDAGRS